MVCRRLIDHVTWEMSVTCVLAASHGRQILFHRHRWLVRQSRQVFMILVRVSGSLALPPPCLAPITLDARALHNTPHALMLFSPPFSPWLTFINLFPRSLTRRIGAGQLPLWGRAGHLHSASTPLWAAIPWVIAVAFAGTCLLHPSTAPPAMRRPAAIGCWPERRPGGG